MQGAKLNLSGDAVRYSASHQNYQFTAAAMKTGYLASYVVLASTSGLAPFFVYRREEGAFVYLALAIFTTIFLNAVVSFYRKLRESRNELVLCLIRNTQIAILTLTIPTFATAIFMKYDMYSLGNFVPTALGLVTFYTRVACEESNRELEDLNRYASIVGVFMVATKFSNGQASAAVLLFLTGRHLFECGLMYFQLTPHALFNFFLSGFVLNAGYSLIA